MTWKGFWEGIASLFDTLMFGPLDEVRKLELDTWWGANIISWVLLLIGAVAFIYWLLQLKNFNESTESTYTYNEHP